METIMKLGPFGSAAVLFRLLMLGAATAVQGSLSSVPGLFIFGDSLADVGTNNYITDPDVPKADFEPYGETFFRFPTGRFSDGRLIPDFVAEYLYLPFPPPYLRPSFDPLRFIRGANFASAGSGILSNTNSFQGVINLPTQLTQFQSVASSLKRLLGNRKGSKIIKDSIYMFIAGNNDISQYLSNTTLQQQFTLTGYIQILVSQLAADIQIAIDAGARKIFVGNMGSSGCAPVTLVGFSSTTCVDFVNQIALLFDDRLLNQVNAWNAAGPAKVVYGNGYNITLNLILNGASQGFTRGSRACCGSGPFNGSPDPANTCGRGSYTLCSNVNEYVFWDFTHPTERVYHKIADAFWYGNTTYIQPINLSQLVSLSIP